MIKTPIIIAERKGVDIKICSSLESAQRAIEAIDVKNNEYVIYSADARLLIPEIVIQSSRYLFWPFPTKVETVAIRESDSGGGHDAEVRAALERFLLARGDDAASFVGASLDRLIQSASTES